jgi:ATP-dependent helicase HepA
MQLEQSRLTSLAEINPAIRQTEIEALETAALSLADTLQSAELGLDAIRVAIVTEPN